MLAYKITFYISYICQESKGIRQWSTNLFSSPIQTITTFNYYNYWLKSLETQLNEPNIQNSLKVPKVVKQTNKETLL